MWFVVWFACVNHRLEALEARVAALEAARPSPPARPTDAEAAAEAEAEARALLAQAVTANEAGDVPTARARLAELRERYPSARATVTANRLDAELAVIGQPMPALEGLRWLVPGTLDPSRPTVVLFFEAWCPHCKREMPRLAEMLAAERRLQALAITKETRGATDAEVESLLADSAWTGPVGVEDGSWSDRFGVTGIPAAAVVVDGAVVWRGHPARLTAFQLAQYAR